MDYKLIDKYFNDRCSPEELELVINWFQTEEGQKFLEKDFEKHDWFDRIEDQNHVSEIESKKLFTLIQNHKRRDIKRAPFPSLLLNRGYITRVASIIFIAAILSFGMYLIGVSSFQKKGAKKPEFLTYATAVGQQKVFKLSNGIKIWLNENSELIVPKH